MIEVNGVSLPDIPSEVLAQYPYAVILDTNDGWHWMWLCAEPLYAVNGVYEVPVLYFADGVGSYKQYGYDGDESYFEWTLAGEFEELELFLPIGEFEGTTKTLVWSNNDIYAAEIGDSALTPTDTIYFARNDSDPNYYAPKSWFDGMARQVMRLTGTSDKLNTTEMLELAKGVEVGGGGSSRYGEAVSVCPASAVIIKEV